MKLAEALQERADAARRIEQLRNRLITNALTQEGVEPAEAPDELLRELDECLARQESLITRINLTNSALVINGEPLTALLARRDGLKAKISTYRGLLERASQAASNLRGTRSEIRLLPTVDVRSLQKQVDALAHSLRVLDNTIQAANWQFDLQPLD